MKRCVDCGRMTKGNMLISRLDGMDEPLCDRCAGRDLLARTLRWLDPSRREIAKASKLYAEIKRYGVDRDAGSEQHCPRCNRREPRLDYCAGCDRELCQTCHRDHKECTE